MKIGRFVLRRAALGMAAMGVTLLGCRGPQTTEALHRFEYHEPHMGTVFTITLFAPNEAVARTGSDAAFASIAALDQMMTDYDPESELMRLCQHPVGEPAPVSAELFDALAKAQQISKLTEGAFDVTIGPVVRLWRRARRAETLPATEQLARARESVGWWKLQLNPGTRTVSLTVPNMQLDLGGIAKGYAADKALEVLRQHGITHALVAASGDIAVGDAPPGQRGWRVEIGALERANDQSARILLLKNAAVSTSGDTEQYVEIGGKRYSHIVDPRTGIGLTERLQVSVVGKRAAQTDAMATATSVLGWETGQLMIKAQPDLAAVLTRRNGEKLEECLVGQLDFISRE